MMGVGRSESGLVLDNIVNWLDFLEKPLDSLKKGRIITYFGWIAGKKRLDSTQIRFKIDNYKFENLLPY
jgi:hypothetical protein